MSGVSNAWGCPKYRPDIDGLRAVAVLSVVTFHAFQDRLPGGAVGVDVFFVISGFLISSILFSSLEKGRLSIVDFYDRRIRRILPALVTVLIACLMLGWFRLLAPEYELLGKHVLGGAGFASNWVILLESGRHDVAPAFKPLAHLWSLAIEEQFYLAWPLLLALIWKRGWSFLGLTALIALLSFAYNLDVTDRSPAAAFYSPFSRFWELMAGGVLAYVALYRPEWQSGPCRDAESLAGAALLATGLVIIDDARPFPGWWALMPVAGAGLLIHAGPAAWVNRHVLAHRALVGIGLISYPLYLWHWPLLSFAHLAESPPSAMTRATLVVVSVGLAWLTYRLVEQPLRFARHPGLVPSLLSALLATGLAGFTCVASGGYENTGPRDSAKTAFLRHFQDSGTRDGYVQRLGIHDKYRDQCNFRDPEDADHGAAPLAVSVMAQECHTRQPGPSRAVMLWGDTQAAQLYFGLRQQLPRSWEILQVTAPDCPPTLDEDADASLDHCGRSNEFALKTIAAQKPDVLIVAQENTLRAAAMADMETRLKSLGAGTVLFTGPAPRWKQDLPTVIVKKLWEGTPRRSFESLDTRMLRANQRLHEQTALSPNGRFVSLIDYFCNTEGCLTYLGEERLSGLVSWNGRHLTPPASDAFARDRLVPMILALTEASQPGGEVMDRAAPSPR